MPRRSAEGPTHDGDRFFFVIHVGLGTPRCCEQEQDEEQAPQADGSAESTSETDEAEPGSAEQVSHPAAGALEPLNQ